ncbi:ABC transporter permease [Aestuariirhabdus litorea]|uniref:ABC transporter permease n=1 Tax=Aestuariirhabdus litorea TaxID=2528527 RepID=A0A3P3VTS0_9GAMM|nr:ABC transporter permease [Aestuariirhabdus litorea]RRJ84153.1 ABC transporter permease [Aestuariirhabdus litorea]RWW97373.1 FtsX-like permease family protein [Endozoicomonadaceae bacterium GTF-13]
MSIIPLAWKSLLNRRTTALLTLVSIAISVALLLGVEKLRTEAKRSFTQTLSGTDLVVGARTGPIQLMLYSIFRIGDATNSISWESYEQINANPRVAWTIPLSLGDSHRGYRVLGTNDQYLAYYRYGNRTSLQLAEGSWFKDIQDAVIGAEVARALGYGIDDPVVLAHGTGRVSFVHHDDQPFRVSGVLAPTGTPVDQTIHVSLEAIELIHEDWDSGTRAPSPSSTERRQRVQEAEHQHETEHEHEQELEKGQDKEHAHHHALEPGSITAALVGLKSRATTLLVQREINEYRGEPLLAIIPGVTLRQLWSLVGAVEQALLLISSLVVIAGLIGMLTSLLTSLNERRREMAILRALGARPRHIFSLMLCESVLLAGAGSLLGAGVLYLMLLALQPLISQAYGIEIAISAPTAYDLGILTAVILGALIVGLLPAWRAYRQSLSDGLSPRT